MLLCAIFLVLGGAALKLAERLGTAAALGLTGGAILAIYISATSIVAFKVKRSATRSR